MNNVIKVMKDLRLANKLSQKHIANKLGITRQAYSRYETGDREPGLETISFLADYYKVPVQTFFMKEEKIYKYENLFMTELGVLYDRKYMEVLKINDYLHFNEMEKQEAFAYDKKNQVSEDKLKEYEKVYKKLLSQLDKIGNEIIKSLDKDKEYFDMDKYREYLQSTKK
jgi:transcriptional regulator with XRE-family HTH domain